MAGSDTQIRTKFVLEGVSKALGELRSFVRGVQKGAADSTAATKASADGMRNVGNAAKKSGSEAAASMKAVEREAKATGRSAVGVGAAFSTAGKVITGSFSTVITIFRALRTAAAETFGYITSAGVASAAAVRGVFGAITSRVTGLFRSQASMLKASMPANLSLSPSAGAGLIRQFASIALQSAATFSSIFTRGLGSVWQRLAQLPELAGKIRRVGMFLAAPATIGAIGAGLGANAVRAQSDTAADTAADGFSVGRSSRIQSYFEQIGERGEDAISIMRKFGEASRDIAANGAGSEFAQSLAAAGIAFYDLNGQARSGVAIFEDLTDAFRNGVVGTAQYEAVASALQKIVGTGKDSTAFYRLLNQISGAGGAERLRELSEQAERFGTVIGPEQLASMRAYQSGLGVLKQAYQGLTIALSTALGPNIGAVLGGFGTLLATNRQQIVEYARGLVDSALLMATEFAIVATQTEKQFGGYQFRFPWLVTLRRGVVSALDVLRGFVDFIKGAAPLAMAVFSKAADQLTSPAQKVGTWLGQAIVWVRTFVASLAGLYAVGQVEPGFEWLQTVTRYLGLAWQGVTLVIDKIVELNKAIGEGLRSDFGRMLADGAARAYDYVVALGGAIARLVTTGSTTDGFEWLSTVASVLESVKARAVDAAGAFVTFVKAMSGDEQTLAENPALAQMRDSLAGFLDTLKTTAENIWAFVSSLVPPFLSFVNNVLGAIKPKLAELQDYLQRAGSSVVEVVKAMVAYFSGADIKSVSEQFAWVYSVLDAVRDIAKTIAGIVRVGVGQILNPDMKLSPEDKDFTWVQRAVQFFQLLRDVIMGVGNVLSALTFGALGPVQATLALFFGVKLVGMLGGALAKFADFKGKLVALFSGIGPLIVRGLAGVAPAIVAALAGGLTALATGSGLGGLGVGLATLVAAGFASKGFRAALAARAAAGEGAVAAEAAIASRVAPKAAGAAGAAVAAGGAVTGVADAAALGGAALAGRKTAITPREIFERNKAEAAARAAKATAPAAGEAVAAGAAKVAAEEAGAFGTVLRGAGAVISRFAGAALWVPLGIELGNLLLEVTGAKKRISEFLFGKDQIPLDPANADARRAMMTGGSSTPSIDGLKTERTAAAQVDMSVLPTPFDLSKYMIDFGYGGDVSYLEGLKRYNLDKFGQYGVTPEQQLQINNPDNYYARKFRPTISQADVGSYMSAKEGEYNAAAERRALQASGSQAPPAVDPESIAGAVQQGVQRGLEKVGRPLVVGAPDDGRSQRAALAPLDVVPAF